MKKIIAVCFLVILSSCRPPDAEPKYNYKSIKTTFPYTDWKKDLASAQKKVKEEFDFYSKDACRRIAYGWTLHKVKKRGAEDCEETQDGHHCRMKDVELECRQLSDK